MQVTPILKACQVICDTYLVVQLQILNIFISKPKLSLTHSMLSAFLICIERVLTRKAALESFWNYHVEEELRERSLVATTKFPRNSDREKIMRENESLRRSNTYKHHYCDENCRKHGSSQNGNRVKCLVSFNISTRIETRQGIPTKLDAS